MSSKTFEERGRPQNRSSAKLSFARRKNVSPSRVTMDVKAERVVYTVHSNKKR